MSFVIKRKLFSDHSETTTPKRHQTKAPPSWMQKSPNLALNFFTFNGKQYQVEQLPGGKGSFHKVFRFITKDVIRFDNTLISTQDLVLKILNRQNVGPNKDKSVIEGDVNGYKHLTDTGAPVAKVYIDPITFTDTQDPKNGKFWIVERMSQSIDFSKWEGNITYEQLDPNSQDILRWAKDWLTQMAQEKIDLINDFRVRNTMIDPKGNLKIVDYSLPEDDEWDILNGICSYAKDWAKGNPNILEFLNTDFPEDIKKTLKLDYATFLDEYAERDKIQRNEF